MSVSPRVKTGIAGLDKMLGGGFMRGDSVLTRFFSPEARERENQL